MLPLMLAESTNSSSSRRQLGTEWNASPYSWYVYAVIPPTLSLGSHDLRNFHANCSSWPFSCQYSKVSWSFTFLSSVISFFWSWIHLFSRAAYVGKLCLIYHYRDYKSGRDRTLLNLSPKARSTSSKSLYRLLWFASGPCPSPATSHWDFH